MLDILTKAVIKGIERGLSEHEATRLAAAAFRKGLPKSTTEIVRSLHKGKGPLLQQLERDKRALADEIRKHHGSALANYEATCYLAYELGAALHEQYLADERERTSDSTCEVGFLLHGRACTVAAEVLHLISGGYSDAAAARQRTLYEVAVVLDLITSHAHLDLADRYIDYAVVEQYEDLTVYQENAEAMRHTPLPQGELEQMRVEYEEVLARCGSHFRKCNQWAAPLFGNLKDIQFRMLEEEAGVSHRRPYYRFANHQIHAGPRAALLNLRQRHGCRQLFIGVGAHPDDDFAEIAHLSLIHLLHCTASIAVYVQDHTEQCDPDLTVGLMCLQQLVEDTGLSLSRSSRRG